MIPKTSFSHRIAVSFAAALLLLLVPGCEDDVVINQEFSVNLMQPGPKWPKEKKFSPAQKEVYAKYGKPDHFRAWWNPTGEVKMKADLHNEMKDKQIKKMPPHSWVYLRQGKEILFRTGNYEEIPLTDQVKVLAQLGDPEDVKELGSGLVQWQYFGAGRLFKFSKGMLVEKKEFPSLGQYIK